MHPVNCRCSVCLVDRSSFGTPEAKAARESVSDERAALVMDRVRELDAETHDLAHLRELESAATRGPWEQGDGWVFAPPPKATDALINVAGGRRRVADADLALIAAMRNELPWLLDQAAENARLRERLARVEAGLLVISVETRHYPTVHAINDKIEELRAVLAEPDAPEGSES